MTQDDFTACLDRQAQYRLRNYDQAYELAIELENMAAGLSDPARLELALYLKGEALEKLGKFSEAKSVLLTLEKKLLQRSKKEFLLLDLYECLGKACYAIGELNLALEYWSACLELSLEHQSIVHYIKAYTGIGGVYLYYGFFEDSLRHHLLALDYAKELDDPVLLMMLNLWLGSDYNELGQHQEALKHLALAQNFYRRQADTGQVSEVLMHMGFSYLGLGNIVEAFKAFNDAVQIAENNHHAWPMSMAHLGMSELFLLQARYKDALTYAQKAQEYAVSVKSVHHELRACRVKSAAYEGLNEFENALLAYERHYELSVKLAQEITMTQLQSSALRRINRSEIRLKLLRTEQQKKNLENESILRQAEFLAEKNALMAVNQAKSEFLALVSHEIRTPLSGVIGMLRLAKAQKELRPNTREQISIGLENAEMLMGIINDLLDASKIEAGKISIETIPFDLHRIIAQVSALFAPKAEEKGLAFLVDVAHLPHEGCLGDPTRLRQVLINLVSNAIKFTEHGSIKLSAYRDGEQIKFSVVDTGIGLDEQSLGRIFNKFEQADTSTTRKYGGTGLGLSICHALIELMHGSIAVTSQLGEGTCFRVDVPLEPVQLMSEPEAEPIVLAPLPYQLKILYAEDIVTNQLIVGALLEEMGLGLQVVNTGLAAIEALAKEQFDLVLMDGRMPVMDGLTATRLIRQGGHQALTVNDPEVYIVALTANAAQEDRQFGLEVGMNDYLLKPIDPIKLRKVIMDACEYQLNRGRSLQPLFKPAAASNQALSADDVQLLHQLELAGVAVNEALQRLNGNVMRFKRWLWQFFQEQQNFFAELDELVLGRDIPQLISKVHALRGVAGTLGLTALYEQASLLEQNLNHFTRHGGVYPDANRLSQAWAHAQQTIWPLVQMTSQIAEHQPLSKPLPKSYWPQAGQLQQALESNSLRARHKLQELLALLEDSEAKVSLGGVIAALDRLDYPAALLALQAIMVEGGDE
ncbi:ATP-binding protein [Chitinibacter sp. GC72]|uniref:ATP-binding protein n=1 Tax=Chitinibacter sp. GC72 TaxID=1526917 RepID=UPI0012FCD985|nr:ATP-binding protein [Chitinibacter sp. GC72]